MVHLSNNLRTKKVCIFINVDWFALSHFEIYLKELVKHDVNVTLLTTNTGRCEDLRVLGIEVIEIKMGRGYSSFFVELQSIRKIFISLRDIKPDVFEMITIKPVIYGGLVSKLLKLEKSIFYMSGLGSLFNDKTFMGRCKTWLLKKFYKILMAQNNVEIIVENKDDKIFLVDALRVPKEKFKIIGGVGVNLKEFYPRNYCKKSNATIMIAFVGRMLADKGVHEFTEAVEICKRKFQNAQFYLIGSVDPTNPASLSNLYLESIKAKNIFEYLGPRSDMPNFLRGLDIFVLPSYREGFPRAIMEASATGLPVITTDVVGCRSSVLNNITGLIVPAKDSNLLAEAIIKLITEEKLRLQMGKNGRKHAEANFDVNYLAQCHVAVILD